MKLAHNQRAPRSPDAPCATAFAAYGQLVPAGPPQEHLMDARIFRSIQNRMTRPEWIRLSEPILKRMIARPYDTGISPQDLTCNRWERTIIVPPVAGAFALTLALGQTGQPDSPSTFRFGPRLAVNLKPGVWFSALSHIHSDADDQAEYWIIAAHASR